jgi:hypothetical protein
VIASEPHCDGLSLDDEPASHKADLQHIKHQEYARRAIELAAAGGPLPGPATRPALHRIGSGTRLSAGPLAHMVLYSAGHSRAQP